MLMHHLDYLCQDEHFVKMEVEKQHSHVITSFSFRLFWKPMTWHAALSDTWASILMKNIKLMSFRDTASLG